MPLSRGPAAVELCARWLESDGRYVHPRPERSPVLRGPIGRHDCLFGLQHRGPRDRDRIADPSGRRRVRCGRCPDEARGMIVKAYVVLMPGITGDAALTSDLQEHVKREIAPYKYPRAIEFVAQLPKTETGKLKRFALRQIAQAGAASASASMAAE